MQRQKIYHSTKLTIQASLLLMVYVFGTFFVNVLHSLHHHTDEHICSHTAHIPLQIPEDGLLLFNNAADTAHESVGHSCYLCHTAFFADSVIQQFNYKVADTPFAYHYCEYTCAQYKQDNVVYKPSRAPPVPFS